MKTWRLSKDKYIKLAQRLHACGRMTTDDLSQHPDYEERQRENKEIIADFITFNPNKLPIFIDYWTKRGLVRFIRK